jgi:acetyl-CoA/propionyl-CoA carboxylase biotin carboxyl carrier protein
MGGKIAARQAAVRAGVPVVPGTVEPVTDVASVRALGEKFGYPIAVKASAGGGGKGLKVAYDAGEVQRAVELAAAEASAYFKDATLYVEKYLAHPKHVEVQVLGDKAGSVVHMGERDCSMQRRHQKLVEETPACISAHVREKLHAAAVTLARSIGYDSAGTIECLVEGDQFYFLEMNTRIQVEHTVTEMTWGVDLVKAQIRIAAGERLWFTQTDLARRGHAIECRVNAESPAADFRPCAGTLVRYVEPGGPGVRVDAAAAAGMVIPQEYDSLIGKLVTWGQDRDEARARMLRALGEYTIEGVETTIPFLRALVATDTFAAGDYATPTVDEFRRELAAKAAIPSVQASDAAVEAETPATLTVEVADKRYTVRVLGFNGVRAGGARRAPKFKPTKRVSTNSSAVIAPMHGIVAEIRVKPGDDVSEGQVVAVIEAMKMMNEVVAHRAGKVASIAAASGETVETGSALIAFEEGAS